MAGETNQTTIRVLRGVPLDSSYTDTIKFASASAQTSFFLGKQKYAFENCTYQRVNNSVAQPRIAYSCRVPQVADNLYDCNYIMFQNSGFGNKWFYCFIKQVNYINPNNTEIIYEIDDYQTWAFDFEVLPSYVEREHSLTDYLFENVEDEPVSIHYYKEKNFSHYNLPPNNVVVASTTDSTGKITSGEYICNLYNGLTLKEFASPIAASAIKSYIDEFAEEGRLESIVAIQQTPFLKSEFSGNTAITEDWSPSEIKISTMLTFPLGDYTPRNKKLYSYPYCYISLGNGDGENVLLYPQVFKTPDEVSEYQPTFRIVKVYGIPPAICCYPLEYASSGSAGLYPNLSYGISGGSIPPCNWVGNYYENWWAQNGVSMAVSSLFSVASGVVSGVSGSPTGVLNAVGGLAGNFVKDWQASKVSPPLNGKPINGNLNMGYNRYGFDAKLSMILSSEAQHIDEYFDMFGYATNKLKVPNMEGRESWNYVKTNNVIIKGSLPVDAMNRIKAMFNNGIRFWHGDFVGDYSRSNRPLSEVKDNV